MTSQDSQKNMEKLLTPHVLKSNLVMASLYLSAFEILKTSIVERIKKFFTDYNGNQLHVSSDYRNVTRIHKDELQASCLWLEQNGAITSDEVLMMDSIRQHRNKIAHELPHFLIDVNREIDIQNFENIRCLLRKIEVWWIREVEIPSNSDFDGLEVADENIQPGPVLLLDVLVELALERTQLSDADDE